MASFWMATGSAKYCDDKAYKPYEKTYEKLE